MDEAEQLVSEAMKPVPGTLDPSGMARGEPGLPRRFVWRDEEHEVAEVLETWKTSGLDAGELYLRRHWYKVRTQAGRILKIYCQRTGASPTARKSRWWVYSVEGTKGPGD
ncbi:MAG: DUF6504 family protein [Phycisphaerales bacterium JB038]